LDIFLSNEIDALSRSKIHHLIRNGDISVNGILTKPSHRLKISDVITVHLPSPEPIEVAPENISLTILFEDDYYIALNKPKGLVVHPGAGNIYGTLVGGLVNYTSQLSSIGGTLRPGLVHRLDKDTTGVLIVAKNDEAHWKLGRLFADRQVYKEYRAFVWGTPDPSESVIEQPIGRSPANRKKFVVTDAGRFARSRYEVLYSHEIMSEVKVIIETGRTHQIRVHMQYIGHPVVGDGVYGGKNRSLNSVRKLYQDLGKQILAKVDRQLLHAYCIRFQHPIVHKNLEIIAPLPEDFIEIENLLKNQETDR